jgi:membrane protease YdiL (CAAX protease family)
MKNTKTAIFIETGAIVFSMLLSVSLLTYVFPKVMYPFSTNSVFVNAIYYIINIFLFTCILYIILQLVYYENKKNNFLYLLKRFRFKKITKKTISRAVGIFLIITILSGFIKLSLDYFKISSTITENLELIKKNKISESPILILLSILAIVIIGPLVEEIVFRGYLLPKQEQVLGKYAWILNGFAFLAVHLIVYDFYSLLIFSPFAFLIAYKVQKYKDSTIGSLVHVMINSGFVVRMLLS